jgi:predicted GNAT superfamily acetyltransferase
MASDIDPVLRAWEASRAADAAASVVIELAETAEDQRQVREVLDHVWPGEGTQVTPNLLRALVHSGSYCSLARDRDTGRPLGAALGLVGRSGEVPGGVFVHSHMAGVWEDYRDRHIGTALKLHQRAWSMGEGIPVVAWTFDPLVRRNAFFNVVRLGVQVRSYHEDFYGEMTDAVNAGDRSDRLVAWWQLDSTQASLAAAGELRAPSSVALVDVARALLTDVNGEPVTHEAPTEAETVLVHLPSDAVAVRRADPARALRWRFALREAMRAAYDAGLRVSMVTTDGAYVLEPTEGRWHESH